MTDTMPEVPTFADARLHALFKAPYFASALMRLTPVATEDVSTFAVDAGWRCYYSPTFLAEHGAESCGGVLVHEVSHLLREHHARAEAIPGVDRRVWNYATDAAINDDLAGLGLPDGLVTPEALGLEPGGFEEGYYRALMEDREALGDPNEDDGSEGCGSGAGEARGAYELPEDAPGAPAVSATDAYVTRRQVAEHVAATAAGKLPGTVPAGLARWAAAILAPPVIDWRTQLVNIVGAALRWRAGQTFRSYTRPGRRRVPGVLLPGRRTPVVSLAAVIDTSGSMSQAALTAVMGEISGIMAAGRGRGLSVITCDAEAQVTHGVTRLDQIELVGGGGTDMRIGIEAALSEHPDAVIVLTDGFTPWPDEPLRVPLIVALVGDGGRRHVPEWAHLVLVPEDAA